MKPLFGFIQMDGRTLLQEVIHFDRLQNQEASWMIQNTISLRLKE